MSCVEAADMPLVVTLRFPHGRYHATPWGRQVNEGRAEWPPSPWRIARTLLSAWHRHGGPSDEESLQTALQLLAKPVTFHVPRTGHGHARHYFPLAARKKGKSRDDTTLGMDPFIVTRPGAPCVLVFDADPTPNQVELLASLAAQVGYLGRAESPVDIDISTTIAAELLAALEELPGPDDLAAQDDVEQLLAPAAGVTLEQLRITTAQLRDRRIQRPPGSRAVLVPHSPTPGGSGIVRRPPRSASARPELVVLRLLGRPLPRLGDAVVVAEQVRQAARQGGARTVAFTGRRDDDNQLDHVHAYWLPLPDALDGRRAGVDVTQVAVWCPGGFEDKEVRALVAVGPLVWGEPGSGPLPLEYARSILGDSLVASPGYLGAADQSGLALFAEAVRWHTLTPVTTTRHQKRRQSDEDFFVDAVRRQLRHTGHPYAEDEVEVRVDPRAAVGYRAQRNPSVRDRTGGTHRRTYVQLRFREPVRGPVVLGTLSHFGLGTLVPEEG
jgi:CRISPR-associated protein Csb2